MPPFRGGGYRVAGFKALDKRLSRDEEALHDVLVVEPQYDLAEVEEDRFNVSRPCPCKVHADILYGGIRQVNY